jgi:hypothetical protein
MKRVKLLIIALISFLVASCGTLIYRATAFSLCGLIGFNSITCNGYFLELDKANALNIPEASNSNIVAQYNSPNLSGKWIYTSGWFGYGCVPQPEKGTGSGQMNLTQRGNRLTIQGGITAGNDSNPSIVGDISGNSFTARVTSSGTEYFRLNGLINTSNQISGDVYCGKYKLPFTMVRQSPNNIVAPTSQRPIAQRPSNQLRETKCREDVEFASSSSGVYIKSAIRQIPQNGKCNEKSPTLLASFNSNMSTVQLSIDNQYLMTIVGVNTPQWQIRTASNNEGKENDIAQSISSSLAINSSLSFSKKTKQLISRTTDANQCYDIKRSCDFWKNANNVLGEYLPIILSAIVSQKLSTPIQLTALTVIYLLRGAYSLRCNLYFPNSGYENEIMKDWLSKVGEARREIYRRNQEKVRCDQPPNKRPPNQPNVPSSETFRLRLGIGACFDFCKLYINGKLVLETGPGGFPVDGITLPRGTHTARMTIENRPHPKPDAAKGMFSVEGVVNHSKKVYVYQGIPEWTVLPTGIIYDQSKSFSLP